MYGIVRANSNKIKTLLQITHLNSFKKNLKMSTGKKSYKIESILVK